MEERDRGGEQADAERSPLERIGGWRVLIAGGAAVIVAIVVLLLVGGGDGNESENVSGAQPTGGAVEASVADLERVASDAGHPVYWAGEMPDTVYELTIDDAGNIYVRYLEPDVEIGSDKVVSLTVGTYPVRSSLAALQSVAEDPGATTDQTPDGGFVVTTRTRPQSVYIAYPGSNYQIEVYDPDPERALRLATSGRIKPIG